MRRHPSTSSHPLHRSRVLAALSEQDHGAPCETLTETS